MNLHIHCGILIQPGSLQLRLQPSVSVSSSVLSGLRNVSLVVDGVVLPTQPLRLGTTEFQTAGVTLSRAVCRAGRPDGPGHWHARCQHPAGAQGPRRHQHRPGRGDVHLPHIRRGRITHSCCARRPCPNSRSASFQVLSPRPLASNGPAQFTGSRKTL